MKWEDNIKETLEKRTIKPSDTSWNALADRLGKTDKKKGKVMYLWMGVAASVVAIIFTITLFFNNNSTEIQKPVLVDREEKVDDLKIPMEKLPAQEYLVKTQQDLESLELFQENTSKRKPLKEQNIETPMQENLILVENKKEESLQSLEIIPQREILEDQKVSEIVAQIQDLKSKGQTVTETDIDALLHQAQKEIAYQSILQKGHATVDANALLQDVESDLQQSFRNKIFEALRNSYETLKTAVAERHN